jgi:hypothetical protein
MQQICPVCNGLSSLQGSCSDCGSFPLGDLGASSDYFGSYSPYEEISAPAIKGPAKLCSSGECLHLLQCPRCNIFRYIPVEKVIPLS